MTNLNVKKLLKTDFIDRFLGFVERYDNVRSIYLYDNAKKWVDEQDFDSIRHFLHTTPIEYSLPFTIHRFISMSYDEFAYFQGIFTEVSALLDEKKALYQELNSFYE